VRLKAGQGFTMPVSWSEVVAEVVHPLGFAVAFRIPAQLAIRKTAPRISIRGSNLSASGTHDKNLNCAMTTGFGQGKSIAFRQLRGRMVVRAGRSAPLTGSG